MRCDVNGHVCAGLNISTMFTVAAIYITVTPLSASCAFLAFCIISRPSRPHGDLVESSEICTHAGGRRGS